MLIRHAYFNGQIQIPKNSKYKLEIKHLKITLFAQKHASCSKFINSVYG